MWECEWEKGRVEDDPEQYFIIFIISLLYPAMENGACGAHNHNSDVAARGTRRVTTIKTLPSHGIVRIAQGLVHVKVTISINPILNKPAAAGLLATLTVFTDAKACTSSDVIFDDEVAPTSSSSPSLSELAL